MRWNDRAVKVKGGKARADKLTPERRSEIARMGGEAARGKPRKSRKRRKKKAKKKG